MSHPSVYFPNWWLIFIPFVQTKSINGQWNLCASTKWKMVLQKNSGYLSYHLQKLSWPRASHKTCPDWEWQGGTASVQSGLVAISEEAVSKIGFHQKVFASSLLIYDWPPFWLLDGHLNRRLNSKLQVMIRLLLKGSEDVTLPTWATGPLALFFYHVFQCQEPLPQSLQAAGRD